MAQTMGFSLSNSILPMQYSIKKYSINSFPAHIFPLFIPDPDFDSQIQIITATKYLLE